MKKYEIDMSQTRTITVDGVKHILHRIKAVRRLVRWAGEPRIIPRGNLGGWVEEETNLSQMGECERMFAFCESAEGSMQFGY